MSDERRRIDDAKRELEGFLKATEPHLTEASVKNVVKALDRPVNRETVAQFIAAHSCPRSRVYEIASELIQFKPREQEGAALSYTED